MLLGSHALVASLQLQLLWVCYRRVRVILFYTKKLWITLWIDNRKLPENLGEESGAKWLSCCIQKKKKGNAMGSLVVFLIIPFCGKLSHFGFLSKKATA